MDEKLSYLAASHPEIIQALAGKITQLIEEEDPRTLFSGRDHQGIAGEANWLLKSMLAFN